MHNLILTPELLQALNAALASKNTDPSAKFDAADSSTYFARAAKHAANFDERSPDAAIVGLQFDGDPRWNFSYPGMTAFDGAESTFIARQLEYLRPGIYAKKYPMLLWSQHIPANYNVPTGAAAYTVTGTDYAGQVKVAKLPVTDANMVNQSVFQGSMGFFSMTLGYQYNIQEVREAIFAGTPLQATLAMNCRNLMERKLDEVAYLGEVSASVKGLLNLSGMSSYTVPATGSGGTTSWDKKAPEDILVDLNGPVDKMIVDTNSVEVPNAWLLPVSRDRVIQTRRLGDGSDVTIKNFFLKNQSFISDITTTYRSEAAPNSDWTGKRGVVYQNDPECIEMVIPQPFEQFAPVAMHTTVTTICHMRTGGVAAHKSKCVIYVDGI